MKNDLVELEVGDGIAWLILNRPTALNALSLEMVERFADRVKSLRGRRDVRVVVTRGLGRAFAREAISVSWRGFQPGTPLRRRGGTPRPLRFWERSPSQRCRDAARLRPGRRPRAGPLP